MEEKRQYVIYNVHPRGENLSASEVITKGNVARQMTSHGLGSGIYGFISLDKARRYKKEGDVIDMLKMERPLVLHTPDDKSELSFISLLLNETIVDILRDRKEEKPYNIFLSNLCRLSNIPLKQCQNKIPMITIEDFRVKLLNMHIGELYKAILRFIYDYVRLEGDQYIKMPINYLLDNDYDGVYNIEGDNAAEGSVLYDYRNGRAFSAVSRSRLLKGEVYRK